VPHEWSHIVEQMTKRFELRVRKWRKSMSGCSWRVYHDDGRVVNWIEAPRPRTRISLAIFLHECGHHAIGFDTYKRRCEEEYHVWMWTIAQMRTLGIEPDERVLRRVERSMQYALCKAIRRGIKHVPQVLRQYLPDAA
jgi:hypothetical protein